MTDNIIPFISKTSPQGHLTGRESCIVNANTTAPQRINPERGVALTGHARLTPAQRMSISANILQELELLHRDNAIDTATMNKLFHQIGHIARGYSLTDPQPPLAS